MVCGSADQRKEQMTEWSAGEGTRRLGRSAFGEQSEARQCGEDKNVGLRLRLNPTYEVRRTRAGGDPESSSVHRSHPNKNARIARAFLYKAVS